jgi:SAM-dependent methyltransferase
MKAMTLLRMARSGHVRARLMAVRDGQAAVRVAAVAAGLRTGVLDLLHQSADDTAALARRGGWSEESILDAFLHVLAELGLVRNSHGLWQLTSRGRGTVEDEVVRASYQGFSGHHSGLYREIEQQLTGGPGRRDVVEQAEVIAQLSGAMDPFVLDALDKEVRQRRPHRVLDVGCGSGSHLAHLLRLLPGASGLGIESEAAAAALARTTLASRGLSGRSRVLEGDARQVLEGLPDRFDLALLANVIYYLPDVERVPLLRAVAERLDPGGTLMVVTTALTDSVLSREFDLLLRAQEGEMGLPTVDDLCDQLRAAGLTPGKPRRIAPGEPLTAVVATRG